MYLFGFVNNRVLVCISEHACTCFSLCACVYLFGFASIHVLVCISEHVSTSLCLCACMYLFGFVSIRVHVYICEHACTCFGLCACVDFCSSCFFMSSPLLVNVHILYQPVFMYVSMCAQTYAST